MADVYIDFSGARPGAANIKAAGYKGVLRYLSPDIASTAWKRATKDEIAAYRAAGLDVILNFEWYAGRCLEGASAGTADGKTALSAAKAIGYPKGAAIYFSHDTSARNDAAVLAYMAAVKAAIGGYYEVDIYSGYDVVELVLAKGLARYGWQTLAWSGGRIGTCHLYQNGQQTFTNGADINLVRARPLGSWADYSADPTPEQDSFMASLSDSQQADLYNWMKKVSDFVDSIPVAQGQVNRGATLGAVLPNVQALANKLNQVGGDASQTKTAVANIQGAVVDAVTALKTDLVAAIEATVAAGGDPAKVAEAVFDKFAAAFAGSVTPQA